MAEAKTKTALTGDDLLNLAQGMGIRYELIEGEIVEMAAVGGKHGEIAQTIASEIYLYLKTNPIGKVLAAETGFYTRGDDKTVRAPDAAFIRSESIPEEGIPTGYLNIVPALVVEVVSPNDRATQVEQKIQEWLDFEVQIVWVIYPDARRVFVYCQDANPAILRESDTITGGDVLSDFALPVNLIFM